MDVFVGTVLLDEQERIFLIKEEDKNTIGKNRWNLPGGSVDLDESLIEAATRENKEETGYDAEITSLVGCYNCKKRNQLWVYIVFSAKIKGEKEKITDSGVKEGKWFSKEEFLHMDSLELVHPDMQLVYNIAIEEKGLPIDSIKYIDYDSPQN